jgi:hypothetical protein
MPKENFKALVKGNSIDKIVKALGMVQSHMLNELMEDYNCTSVEELAFKLQ